MIIVQLKGGLGNQLFQYAAGWSLASKHNVQLKVDSSLLFKADQQIGTLRSFDLQTLLPKIEVASKAETAHFLSLSLFKRIAQKIKPRNRRLVFRERSFYFDRDFLRLPPTVYLKGYFQTEQYFIKVASDIRRMYQVEMPLGEVALMGQELQASPSISIHIRRGDYLNPVVSAYHGVLNHSYYQQAINYMSNSVPGATYYVFSDDPGWVSRHLSFPINAKVVSDKSKRTAIEDFFLMQQCQHQIIANSTFSWWAAWLNPNPNKIVIAPKKWFNNAPYDTRDLIPAEWIQM